MATVDERAKADPSLQSRRREPADDPMSPAGSELNRSKLGHMPALDGIRGLAILMVMFFHFSPHFGRSILGHLAQAATDCGAFGVDLFFVLSGFLITGILLRSKAKPNFFRNFYVRRALRIFPLYYAALIGITIVAWVDPGWRHDPNVHNLMVAWPWYWFYATNYYVARTGWTVLNAAPVALGHFWSLAIEEHFYLIWPWLFFRLSDRAMTRACYLTLIIAAAFRTLSVALGQTFYASKFTSQCRFDTLAIGGLLALMLTKESPQSLLKRLWWIPAASAMVLAGLILHERSVNLDHPVSRIIGSPLVAVICAAAIAKVLSPGNPFAMIFSWWWLRILGVYSYGLYVYHGILGGYIDKWFSTDSLAGLTHLRFAIVLIPHYALSIGVAFCIAWVSYHCLENPFLKLKRFFE